MSANDGALHVVMATGMLLALSTTGGGLARRAGQPAVVGQLFMGILVGPTALGRFFPLRGFLSGESLGLVTTFSQLGLVLFIFCVGYEIDFARLRRSPRAIGLVSLAGMLLPMALGTVLGWSVRGFMPGGGWKFVAFVALASSITAVPVLASILRERGVGAVPASVALSSAAVMDVVGWLLLSVLVAEVSGAESGSVLRTFGLFLLFAAAMVFVVRPLLRAWIGRGVLGELQVTVVLLLTLVSSWVTGALGLHLIFGAFLAGVVTPRGPDGSRSEVLLAAAQQPCRILLPMYFLTSAMGVNVADMAVSDWLVLTGVCAVAVVGKVVGGGAGARLAGSSWRDSGIIGVLLNTRGLTELIVLNTGLQVGLINGRIYAIFVLMALFTTALTGPLLSRLRVDSLVAAVGGVSVTAQVTPDHLAPDQVPPDRVHPGHLAPDRESAERAAS